MRTYKQRRWGVTIRLDLSEEVVSYAVRDSSGRRFYEVGYERLAFNRVVMVAPRAGYPYMILRYVIPCLGVVGFVTQSWWTFCPILLCVAGLIAWRNTSWFELPMTVVPDTHGGEALRVMREAQHEAILADLVDHRRRRLRALQGEVQLHGELARERAKFDWLLAEGAVNASEHASAVNKIAMAEGPGPPASGRLN